jgi:DNA-binding MarR family transcriptional regulator
MAQNTSPAPTPEASTPEASTAQARSSTGGVEWLDDDEMSAWRGLIEMTADVRAALDTELLGEFGLSEGDYGVLVTLSEAPDRHMRMCDLACRMHLSPSGLTRRLDGLVRDGLVVREPSQEDRRVSLAVLTDQGYARLEAAAPSHVEGVRRHLLDHLTRAQIRQLGAAFDHLRERRASMCDGRSEI